MQRPGSRRNLIAGGALVVAATLAVVGLTLPSNTDGQMSESIDTIETAPRLFFLNIRGQVLAAAPDGSEVRVLVDGLDSWPDGIAVDAEAGHIYWSNMGRAKDDDGSIIRSDLDGGNITTILPEGGTFTAKQLTLDRENGKLYWSDREGMRVQRVNLDGTGLETLVQIARGDEARLNAANWAVGIAVDVANGHIYWTQKGGDNEGVGSIRRASIDIPAGQTAATRQDIEVLFSELPEPIDLHLDLETREIYWTDRGDAPRGNTVNRAPMDPPAGFDPANRTDAEILLSGFDEAIGLALDHDRGRIYVTDLGGNLYAANVDGSGLRKIGSELGSLTGLTVADVPVTTE